MRKEVKVQDEKIYLNIPKFLHNLSSWMQDKIESIEVNMEDKSDMYFILVVIIGKWYDNLLTSFPIY